MLWRRNSDRSRKYKEIRESARLINHKIIKVIPRDVINRTARDMGILSKGVLVFDEQSELDFLFDRIIYDVRWDGRTTIEHFEVENDFELPEMEEKFLEAMKDAYFSLFEITDVATGESLQLSDLLSDRQIELTDISLSRTASKGLLLATRIISLEDIFMTAGVGYPFLPEQKDTIISGLKTQKIVQRGRKKRAVRRIDYSNPRNYSLYFFKQYKRFSTLEMGMSEEF